MGFAHSFLYRIYHLSRFINPIFHMERFNKLYIRNFMKLLIMNIENIEIANRTAQIIVHKGHFEMPPVDTSVLQIRVHDYTYLSYYLTKRYCWCSKDQRNRLK